MNKNLNKSIFLLKAIGRRSPGFLIYDLLIGLGLLCFLATGAIYLMRTVEQEMQGTLVLMRETNRRYYGDQTKSKTWILSPSSRKSYDDSRTTGK